MAKILPILGLVGRILLIVFLIAFIAGVGYTFYYYTVPMDKPRPIDLEPIFVTISNTVRVPLKAPPGPTVLPTQSTTPAAGESTPASATPTASIGAWAAPGLFL